MRVYTLYSCAKCKKALPFDQAREESLRIVAAQKVWQEGEPKVSEDRYHRHCRKAKEGDVPRRRRR